MKGLRSLLAGFHDNIAEKARSSKGEGASRFSDFFYAKGKVTVTVKRSATVSTESLPPQASVKDDAMERPSPAPPSVRLSSPRVKRAVKSIPVGRSVAEVFRTMTQAVSVLAVNDK